MQKLTKEIDYIIDKLDDIENLAYSLKDDVNEFKITDNKTINDIDLFKEKLIQAGLYSDTLNNFIDDYIKFYNE